jgi:hypothetical protein
MNKGVWWAMRKLTYIAVFEPSETGCGVYFKNDVRPAAPTTSLKKGFAAMCRQEENN